jgi:hypothetical protein
VDERGAIKVYNLEFPIIEALIVAWQADRTAVITSSDFGFDSKEYEVARHGQDAVNAPAFVIRKPRPGWERPNWCRPHSSTEE